MGYVIACDFGKDDNEMYVYPSKIADWKPDPKITNLILEIKAKYLRKELKEWSAWIGVLVR